MQFIVEAYQLFKARASGADAVLLIAAVLPNKDLAYLVKSASKLGMHVLIEVCRAANIHSTTVASGKRSQSCCENVH